MANKNKYLFPLILVTSLFFLWGFAHNLNPILIPHLKKACQLNDLESSLIDSAFFIAYFAMALPAGYFMKRYGYKGGIILGLFLFAVGAFLFYPAAALRDFPFFLFALFVIASGLTFLESAANPYIAPVIKLSTNTNLYKKMPDIIDIDCGTIIDGYETIEQVADRILNFIIKVASGEEEAKAMKLGQDDFIPWKRGVSL